MQTLKFRGINIDKQFLRSHNWTGDSPVRAKTQDIWHKHLVRGVIDDIIRGRTTLCYNKEHIKDIKAICKKMKIKIDIIDIKDNDGYFYTITKRRK